MKKVLSFVMLICITFASFAAPWDLKIPKRKMIDVTQPFGKSVFTDPFFTEREIDEAYYNGQRCLHVHVKFSHTVNYAQLYTFEHLGYWHSIGDIWVKYYEIIYPPNTLEKHTYFPLHPNDDPTWGWYNEIYHGPLS